MKNIIKLFTFPLLTIIGFNSCASIPLKIGESENNSTYTVSYLFEHDGCKVYRFYDKGNYVYFTTRGDVTSITKILPPNAPLPLPSTKHHMNNKNTNLNRIIP